MNKIFTIFLLLISSLTFSQQFGNEWINYNQEYYSFPVTEDGIYRLSSTALLNAGVDVNDIPNNFFRLYGRGQEQYIYLKVNNFGILEYIEFYAEKNDGWLDTALYFSPNTQTNPYYSLINDTAYYYLTWGNTTSTKRITLETDVNFSQYQNISYCYVNDIQSYNSSYYDPDGSPNYSKTEGWFDSRFGKGNGVVKTFNTERINKTAGNSILETVTVSLSKASGAKNHHLRIDYPSSSFDSSFTGYQVIKKIFNINSNNISNNTNITFSAIDDLGVATDYQSVSYVRLYYPANFNLQNNNQSKFTIPTFSGAKRTIDITNFNSGTEVIFYDLTNHKRINSEILSDSVKVLIPNSNQQAECFIVNKDFIKNITNIKAVNSTGFFTNYISINQNSRYIVISHPQLWSEAQNYNSYRNSTGHNSCLINIEELYDQFSYGIKKHPLAIKNFINSAISNWATKPEFLFLIGKSIKENEYRKSTSNYSITYVPSMGYPASDNLLTSGLNGTLSSEQGLATGRISAYSNSQVKIYLDKVKEYESNQPTDWMKNVVHFGGGGNKSEQDTFEGYLRNFENIIEDTLFGGNVSTFLKESSAPIQITGVDTVKKLVNTGTSLITFFGHGSTTEGFDQNIDDPINFNNRTKYPFMIANSCYAGDIHSSSLSVSENWVLIQNKGAIGFLASVGQSYAQNLYNFTLEFYKNIAYKNYAKSIGKSLKNTAHNYLSTNLNNSLIASTCLEFTLHGDPAIVLNSPILPDLTISNSDIKFIPEILSTELDSFETQFIISNIGKAITDSFYIEVKRIYPDNSEDIYNILMQGCIFNDTLILKLPINQFKGAGLNKIEISLDFMGVVTEISESNNSASISTIINSGELLPILPYKYAIYPNDTVELIASTGNPFASATDYIFEIDTTDFVNFSNSKIQSPIINSTGGIISWKPNMALTDSSTYFWRVSSSQSGNWKESSFTYIKGKTGWAQSHFFQYKENSFNIINYNRLLRKLEYIAVPKELHLKTVGQTWTSFATVDEVGDPGSCCPYSAVIVCVIDSALLTHWNSHKADYGHSNFKLCCSSTSARSFFVFYADSLTLVSMANMLINSIPDGNYIAVYSFISGNFGNWPPAAFAAFNQLSNNNSQLSTASSNSPFLFFVKKGYPETATELIGNSPTETLEIFKTLSSNYTYGQMNSVKIGPSNNWDYLHWQETTTDSPNYDKNKLSLFAINQANSPETKLFDTTNTSNVFNLNQIIDTTSIEYLRLQLSTNDDSARTPSQLKKWLITYEEVPETAINPKDGFLFYQDTVDEGDDIKFAVATRNISNYNMDSLLVKYWIQDKNNGFNLIKNKRLRPHPKGDVLIDTISFSSLGYQGLNSLWVEFNTIDSTTNKYDQLEQYHFNNIAQKYFYVNSDKINPLLDVTFDGIHILNGDIVSAKPQIVIKLKDENKYLSLNDQSLFAIYLKSDTSDEEKKIAFTDSIENSYLNWIPANLPDNSCKIVYSPNLKDGKYELRVQAKDKSSNESGKFDYQISFEVITKSTITDIFNYPNPFSTSTRFVFTLTGSVLPDELSIQILTITGKLVRVINMDELGNVHIGRNITEYAWDGKDMFGDQLANGVYFYRVVTKLNGESIEKRETGAEQYFKKGFGKMYLMK